MTFAQAKQISAAARGDTLPSEEITLDLTSLIMYAAATWDFHRYHYDADFVKALDLPAPFVDGQIAAIAKVNNLVLVTSNRAHFEPFEGLEIQDWKE